MNKIGKSHAVLSDVMRQCSIPTDELQCTGRKNQLVHSRRMIAERLQFFQAARYAGEF